MRGSRADGGAVLVSVDNGEEGVLGLYNKMRRVVFPVYYALHGPHVIRVEDYRTLEVQAQFFCFPGNTDRDERYERGGVLDGEALYLGFLSGTV